MHGTWQAFQERRFAGLPETTTYHQSNHFGKEQHPYFRPIRHRGRQRSGTVEGCGFQGFLEAHLGTLAPHLRCVPALRKARAQFGKDLEASVWSVLWEVRAMVYGTRVERRMVIDSGLEVRRDYVLLVQFGNGVLLRECIWRGSRWRVRWRLDRRDDVGGVKKAKGAHDDAGVGDRGVLTKL